MPRLSKNYKQKSRNRNRKYQNKKSYRKRSNKHNKRRSYRKRSHKRGGGRFKTAVKKVICLRKYFLNNLSKDSWPEAVKNEIMKKVNDGKVDELFNLMVKDNKINASICEVKNQSGGQLEEIIKLPDNASECDKEIYQMYNMWRGKFKENFVILISDKTDGEFDSEELAKQKVEIINILLQSCINTHEEINDHYTKCTSEHNESFYQSIQAEFEKMIHHLTEGTKITVDNFKTALIEKESFSSAYGETALFLLGFLAQAMNRWSLEEQYRDAPLDAERPDFSITQNMLASSLFIGGAIVFSLKTYLSRDGYISNLFGRNK